MLTGDAELEMRGRCSAGPKGTKLTRMEDYQDAYQRLAAIAKSRNNIQLSIELIGDAIKVNEKCPDALSMLGALELKNDDWLTAKETFRAAREATDGKDSYSALSLGNWNYFAAARSGLLGKLYRNWKLF
ncbi:hypothetical protein IFM89_036487 [Coptis chinensis]|uniref:Uncharacterized protein n=1 Tax=Coptis chinensis TaxID=261450 RepID=A0A835LXF6_9MAGN|nr:hypothetical protein IFM89_036487 [Coptis chinensis]